MIETLHPSQRRSLRAFLGGAVETQSKVEWLKFHGGESEIYVRYGRRYFGRSNVLPCLDVATIFVAESKRSRGWFTAWLTFAEEAARERGAVVYVENIYGTRLRRFLTQRGYQIARPVLNPPSYYLLPCSKAHSAKS